MILLRAGSIHRLTGVPGPVSLIAAATAMIRRWRPRWPRGYGSVAHPGMTAIVRPPPDSAPS
jgi:hypothetical protein